MPTPDTTPGTGAGTVTGHAPTVTVAPAPAGRPPRKRAPSRATRWAEAAGDAVDALQRLRDLQSEYEDWKDNLPENLQGSTLGEKLEAVCDLDLDGALDTATEAEGLDLPLGFGRD